MDFIYFSASGTTREITGLMAGAMDKDGARYDLLEKVPEETVRFGRSDAAVFAFPVFAGRLPAVCPDMIRKFQGDNTAAVAVVVYGNRAYDDALIELRDLLSAQGFNVIAGASLVARHSIFPEVAHGRPDEADKEKILSFCSSVMEKIRTSPGSSVEVKGKRPYVKPGAVALHPSANSRCVRCGRCAPLCPVSAIPAGEPWKTDNKRCISCTACINVCPSHARGFHVPVLYPAAAKSFYKANSVRKEPEFFL